MKSTLLPLGLLGSLLALATGCAKNAQTAPAPPPPKVVVSQPIQRSVVEWDVYPGRLEAVEEVQIRAQVSGYLQSIHFEDGAEVKEGDLLFVIDPRPYEAALNQAEAELLRAQTRLELAVNDANRAERLLTSRAISEEEADAKMNAREEAKASLAAAQANVAAARVNVDFTRIHSPIDGRISRKMITEGNLVNGNQGQSTLLTTIVSVDPVYCYFDVDEASALQYRTLVREGKMTTVANGQIPAELQLANETNFVHKGHVDFIDNQVDPRTGTLRMRAVFPNPGPDRILQPGYFARVRVPGSAEYQALLVVPKAVGTDQSQKFVYTLSSSNTVAYSPIILGPIIDGLQVVRQGLQPDDQVVVTGLMMVRPGAPVEPEQAPMVTASQSLGEKTKS